MIEFFATFDFSSLQLRLDKVFMVLLNSIEYLEKLFKNEYLVAADDTSFNMINYTLNFLNRINKMFKYMT